jgi:hypothetical protein
VVGTANKINNRNDAKQVAFAMDAAPMAAPPASAVGGLSDDAISRLKQLGELHQAGILSGSEFDDQKTKILNG